MVEAACCRKLALGLLILFAATYHVSCTTKKFVRTNVGEVNDKVDTLSRTTEETHERVKANEAHIGEVSQQTQITAGRVRELETELAEALQRNTLLQNELIARDEMPWPPPPPSSRLPIPNRLVFGRQGESLGEVHDRVVAAFRRGGLSDLSVYAIGKDGFAVVSSLHEIDNNGRVKTAEVAAGLGGLLAWIRSIADALVYAQPGTTRGIVVLITSRSWNSKAKALEMTEAGFEQFVASGRHEMSPTLRGASYTSETKGEALIYEFYRRTDDAPAVFVRKGRLSAAEHLASTGLWRAEELH
jgi:hypothetical protein